MPSRHGLVAASLAWTLLGCGGGAGGGTGGAAYGGGVSDARPLEGRFIVSPEPARGSFVFSPRVRKADADLTALLGHPVEFVVTPAVTPKWQDSFQDLSESAIAAVAHRLVELKEQEPTMFRWVTPSFRRVEWDYSATEKYPRYAFDSSAGVLRVVLTEESYRIVDGEALGHALGRAYAAALGGNYAKTDPGAVAPAERAAYAEWLLGYAYGAEKQAGPRPGMDKEADEAVDEARARVHGKMLRFLKGLGSSDAALATQVRQKVLEDVSWLAYTRRNHDDVVTRLGARSDFAQAEAAFVMWLTGAWSALTDRERIKVVEELRSSHGSDGTLKALRGFDLVEVWLRTTDEWLTAGRPVGRTGEGAHQDRDQLFDLLLETHTLPAEDRTGCYRQDNPVYLRLASDGGMRARLFGEVLRRRDVALTRLFAANLLALEGDSKDVVLAFWRAAEGDDLAFRATTRVLAGFVGSCASPGAIYDQLPRLWKAYPKRHGVLAYLAHQYSTEVFRENFTRLFGALAPDQWAAFLDEVPDPPREVHASWRYLSKGWSRMEILSPRLDRWFTDDYRRKETWWGSSLETMAQDICADRSPSSPADLRRLHDWVEKRLAAHPSEMGSLQNAKEKSEPGACTP